MECVFDMDDGAVTAFALNMWANHIETGSVVLSAQDALNMKLQHTKPLTEEQRKFVARLRKMALNLGR